MVSLKLIFMEWEKQQKIIEIRQKMREQIDLVLRNAENQIKELECKDFNL